MSALSSSSLSSPPSSLRLHEPAFLQRLPRGWTCHLEQRSRRIYYHHAELNESVWFAVLCTARRSYQPDVSAGLRANAKRDNFQSKFGVEDLYFGEGEQIMLISSQDDVWWEGELHGKVGIFPASFVRVDRCSPIVELIRESMFSTAEKEAHQLASAVAGGSGRAWASSSGTGTTAAASGGRELEAAAATADDTLTEATSVVQMRALLGNYLLPWHSLTEDELRQFCRHINRPDLQAALFVTDAPPKQRSDSGIGGGGGGGGRSEVGAATAGAGAGAVVHGPILTRTNYHRLLSGLPDDATSPSDFGLGDGPTGDRGRPPAVALYSPLTPGTGSAGGTARGSSGGALPPRRESLNISGSPRLFSLHHNNTPSTGSGSSSGGLGGPPGSGRKAAAMRSLQRSGAAVKESETAALTLRTNAVKTRELAMASPSRMSALQRLNIRAQEHSVLNDVDTEHGDVIKAGFLNILKTSTISLLSQFEDHAMSLSGSAAGAGFRSDVTAGAGAGGGGLASPAAAAAAAAASNSALNSMLHTWHNRFFSLTGKTLGYSKKATEQPKPHNMWTLVGAKIRWVDKTNIHFESTVAPHLGTVNGNGAAGFSGSDSHLSVAVVLCAATQRETNAWFEAIKSVCVPASSDSRAFLTLCRRGQIHAARKILKQTPDAVHHRSPVDGWTALHHAAASSRPEVVDVLVKAKADLEICTHDGYRPIHLAAASGCVTTFAKLQGLGADVTAVTGAETRAGAALLADVAVEQLSCEDIAQRHGRSELVMHLCSQRAPGVKQQSLAAFHMLQRKLIIAELHKTELRYVKGLLTLEKIYLPVLVCGTPEQGVDLKTHSFDMKVSVITPAQARLIFSHISSICRHNEKFFEELNDIFTHWSTDSLLGPLMDDFSTTFLLYTDFVSRLARINACVDELQTDNKAFQARMKQCCAIAGPRLGFNLRTLLIEPVQRIPRYQMLVKTMLDYTPAQSPDFAPLQRALHNISNTANMINDNVAKFAELTILQRLGNRFTPPQILCVGAHRRFLATVDATVMAFDGELHSVQFSSDNALPDTSGRQGAQNFWKQHTMSTKIKAGSQLVVVLLSDIVIFGKPYQFSDSLSFLGSLNLKDCQIEEQTTTPSRGAKTDAAAPARGNAVYLLRSNCCFIQLMIKRSATQKMWFEEFASHARLHIALTLRNSLRHTQSLGQQTLDTSKMVDQSAWLVVIDQIEANGLRKMDILSDSDPFVQFTVVPSELRPSAKGKGSASKKGHHHQQTKSAFLSSLWKSSTYTINDCHDPRYQCCCMLFLGNINEQVYGADGPSIQVEVFDFDDDDSVPEPLGFAQVLLKDIEPSLMQVNIPVASAASGKGNKTMMRVNSGRRRGTPSTGAGGGSSDKFDSPRDRLSRGGGEGSVGDGGAGGSAGADAASPDVVARQLSEPVLEQTLKFALREEEDSKHRARGQVSFRLKLFAIGASAVASLTVSSATKRAGSQPMW